MWIILSSKKPDLSNPCRPRQFTKSIDWSISLDAKCHLLGNGSQQNAHYKAYSCSKTNFLGKWKEFYWEKRISILLTGSIVSYYRNLQSRSILGRRTLVVYIRTGRGISKTTIEVKNNIHGIVFKTIDLFETTRNWQETLFNFKDSVAQIVLKGPPAEKEYWKVAHLRQAVCIASSFGNNRVAWVPTDRVTTSSKNPEKHKKLVGILNVEPASLRCKPHVNITHTVQILLISVLFKTKDRDASGILIIILIFKFVDKLTFSAGSGSKFWEEILEDSGALHFLSIIVIFSPEDMVSMQREIRNGSWLNYPLMLTRDNKLTLQFRISRSMYKIFRCGTDYGDDFIL